MNASEFDLLPILQKYGYNTHSFLSLYPGLNYFHVPGNAGYIAYLETNSLVLAAGDPIAEDDEIIGLITAFLAHFLHKTKYVGFIPVSEKMTAVLTSCGFDKLHIGREPVFDLKHLPQPSRSIKQAVRRAQRKGLKVIPYSPKCGPQYEEAIQKLCHQWESTREIPAMGFLFQLDPLACREQKKYFLLVNEQDQLLALLACSPIYNRNGWYLEDFIRDPSAPNGGSELLLLTAMELLAKEGYTMGTLAVAPLAGLPEKDNQHPHCNEILKLVYRHLSFVYHFQTLEYFKGKFGPSHWENNAFCFYPQGLTPGLAMALIEAFVPGGIPAIVAHKLKQWSQTLWPSKVKAILNKKATAS